MPPTKNQLNPVPEFLDGKIVVEHLLGKTVEDAVALLEENDLTFSEDYMWMGPEAFCYYAPALVRYLQSDAANGDDLFPYHMLITFRLRLDEDGARVAAVFPTIEEFCKIVEEQSDRLGFSEDGVRRARRRIAEVRSRLAAIRR